MITPEQIKAWLMGIEEYLASGDGDRAIRDEDREIIAWLKNSVTELSRRNNATL